MPAGLERLSLRARLYRALYGAGGGGLTALQRVLVVLILGSLLITVLGTERELVAAAPGVFFWLEAGIATAFLVEYFTRLWAVGEHPRYCGFFGRLRYVRTPMALIDLVALAPFLLGVIGAESLVLRMARLVRLLVLAKLVRFSRAIHLLASVIHERRFELGFTVLVASTVVLLAASVLYFVEGELQPDAFGSIPRSMWWAVATLTTVGYGDVYPLTLLGRMFGAVTAFAGIGLIAMPTGILAAALSDALARAREQLPVEAPQLEEARSEADRSAMPR
jgi:voltage-gated potassium channel